MKTKIFLTGLALVASITLISAKGNGNGNGCKNGNGNGTGQCQSTTKQASVIGKCKYSKNGILESNNFGNNRPTLAGFKNSRFC